MPFCPVAPSCQHVSRISLYSSAQCPACRRVRSLVAPCHVIDSIHSVVTTQGTPYRHIGRIANNLGAPRWAIPQQRLLADIGVSSGCLVRPLSEMMRRYRYCIRQSRSAVWDSRHLTSSAASLPAQAVFMNLVPCFPLRPCWYTGFDRLLFSAFVPSLDRHRRLRTTPVMPPVRTLLALLSLSWSSSELWLGATSGLE